MPLHCTDLALPGTNMEVDNGALEDPFPLQPVDFPLQCEFHVNSPGRVYLLIRSLAKEKITHTAPHTNLS